MVNKAYLSFMPIEHKYVLGEKQFYYPIVRDIIHGAESVIDEFWRNSANEFRGFTNEESTEKITKLNNIYEANVQRLFESINRIAQDAFEAGRDLERQLK